MKILLAIDDSKFSEAAVRVVIAQNRPQGTEVRVVHAVEPIESFYTQVTGYPSNLAELQKGRLKQARELVARVAEQLRAEGFKVEEFVYEGTARLEIVDSAAEWHADLLVVGSHGRKGLDRFLIGSVSEYVARHAPCSVEIIRLPIKK
jgi:nucleotide-binding universal stress UspA family protein